MAGTAQARWSHKLEYTVYSTVYTVYTYGLYCTVLYKILVIRGTVLCTVRYDDTIRYDTVVSMYCHRLLK